MQDRGYLVRPYCYTTRWTNLKALSSWSSGWTNVDVGTFDCNQDIRTERTIYYPSQSSWDVFYIIALLCIKVLFSSKKLTVNGTSRSLRNQVSESRIADLEVTSSCEPRTWILITIKIDIFLLAMSTGLARTTYNPEFHLIVKLQQLSASSTIFLAKPRIRRLRLQHSHDVFCAYEAFRFVCVTCLTHVFKLRVFSRFSSTL